MTIIKFDKMNNFSIEGFFTVKERPSQSKHMGRILLNTCSLWVQISELFSEAHFIADGENWEFLLFGIDVSCTANKSCFKSSCIFQSSVKGD